MLLDPVEARRRVDARCTKWRAGRKGRRGPDENVREFGRLCCPTYYVSTGCFQSKGANAPKKICSLLRRSAARSASSLNFLDIRLTSPPMPLSCSPPPSLPFSLIVPVVVALGRPAEPDLRMPTPPVVALRDKPAPDRPLTAEAEAGTEAESDADGAWPRSRRDPNRPSAAPTLSFNDMPRFNPAPPAGASPLVSGAKVARLAGGVLRKS